MGIDAVLCHLDDMVATAVRDLAPGEHARVVDGDRVTTIEVRDPVPFGHKFALVDIRRGEEVIKYGETIGLATSAICRGEHVHLHNTEGLRGRGDLR